MPITNRAPGATVTVVKVGKASANSNPSKVRLISANSSVDIAYSKLVSLAGDFEADHNKTEKRHTTFTQRYLHKAYASYHAGLSFSTTPVRQLGGGIASDRQEWLRDLAQGYKQAKGRLQANTPETTMIARIVFHCDRQRARQYGLVLEAAATTNVKPRNFHTWLKNIGITKAASLAPKVVANVTAPVVQSLSRQQLVQQALPDLYAAGIRELVEKLEKRLLPVV